MDPSKRLVTAVLFIGVVVLLAAVLIGERMGDRVLGQATEKRLDSIPYAVLTPNPNQTTSPYGPGWKDSQVLSVAPDPHFPDPRIPPVPLPTPAPASTAAAVHPQAKSVAKPTPTPDLNVPVWRRSQPLPGSPPTPAPSAGASTAPSPVSTPTLVPGPSNPPPRRADSFA
ncbi:MAG: hypothetical protein M3Y21_12600 [Candidatus Eremiobacteraeota bacterium]|nr:hypothetical protein [Candidatus Eremiobacteraeota bacterium]